MLLYARCIPDFDHDDIRAGILDPEPPECVADIVGRAETEHDLGVHVVGLEPVVQLVIQGAEAGGEQVAAGEDGLCVDEGVVVGLVGREELCAEVGRVGDGAVRRDV